MNKSTLYVSLAAFALLSTGCSKKLSDFKSEYFSTNPLPVETVGEDVRAVVTAHVPAKFMVKNAKVTATPVLSWTENGVGGEAKGEPVVIQGENVRANGTIISFENGGVVNIPFATPYQQAMEQSELCMDFLVDQNGKIYQLPRVKVGNGVLATSTLASAATVTPAVAPDNFQKVINEKYSADIRFLINQANIRANQTSAADYIDLNKQLAEANSAANREIAGITVNSYASPDGSLKFNTELAERREKNTTSLMENQLKKDKITEFGELTSSFTPEDWEGFKSLVEKSNIQDKELILSVLSMYKDPEEREREIRNLASVFNELSDQILPQLRYSKIIASINVIGKSDAEIAQLFASDPKALSADEILYLATLTDDNSRRMDIYRKATELYPNDYRGFNNLGMTEYVAGNYAAAKGNYEKAARLNPASKEVEMNMGLLSLLDGNYAKANEQLGAAAGVPETADALGVYYLTQGEVSNALNAFGNVKTNNSALAHILAKDYTGAKSILAGIAVPDATTYYLTAILGARTGNESMVMSNLRQAVRMDSKLLNRARKDLEFSNYNLSSL